MAKETEYVPPVRSMYHWVVFKDDVPFAQFSLLEDAINWVFKCWDKMCRGDHEYKVEYVE